MQDLLTSEVQLKIFDPLDVSHSHLVLAYLSTYDVLIEGGPTPWEDSLTRENYQVTHADQPSADLAVHLLQSNPRLYTLACQTPTTRLLAASFAFQNSPDLYLPNPKLLSATVQVHCGIPKKLKINDTNTWLLSPQQHLINVYALDDNQKLYHNFTSLALQWELKSQFSNVRLLPLQQ